MEQTSSASLRVLTIGHPNHQIEHFLDLLKSHSVHVVADTRSYPYSKYATQFDQKPLKMALEADGIRYVFLGRELGGRPDGDEFYDDQLTPEASGPPTHKTVKFPRESQAAK
jgi:Protein of unknown function, DUF488